MLFIKHLLCGSVDVEVLWEPGVYDSVAIFCHDLDCVMYLRPRPESKTFQVKTFFDFGEHHTKHYERQKKKCISITLLELKQKFS